MRKYYFVTDEQYAEAEKNGIPKRYVSQRLQSLTGDWDIERAITEPVRKYGANKEWLELARENGITSNSFYQRIRKGMTLEEAATTPKFDRSKQNVWESGMRQRKISKEAVEKAKENGVAKSVLRERIINGMPEELACLGLAALEGQFTDKKVEVGDTVKIVGLGNSKAVYLVTHIAVNNLVTLKKYGFKRKRHVQYSYLRHFEIVGTENQNKGEMHE